MIIPLGGVDMGIGVGGRLGAWEVYGLAVWDGLGWSGTGGGLLNRLVTVIRGLT